MGLKKKKTSVLNLSVCCCLITQLLFLGIAVFPVFRITNNYFLGHWDSVVIHYEQRPTRACRQLKVKTLRKPGETAMGVSMRRCCHLKRHLFIVGEHVFISCLHRLWVRAEPTRSL